MDEKHQFTPADLLFSGAVRNVDVEGLGIVSYIPLTTRETVELSKEKGLDQMTMAVKEIWLMVKKANPDMMPFEEFYSDSTDGLATSTLIDAMLKERHFRV